MSNKNIEAHMNATAANAINKFVSISSFTIRSIKKPVRLLTGSSYNLF
jgi:hypothetical protein